MHTLIVKLKICIRTYFFVWIFSSSFSTTSFASSSSSSLPSLTRSVWVMRAPTFNRFTLAHQHQQRHFGERTLRVHLHSHRKYNHHLIPPHLCRRYKSKNSNSVTCDCINWGRTVTSHVSESISLFRHSFITFDTFKSKNQSIMHFYELQPMHFPYR